MNAFKNKILMVLIIAATQYTNAAGFLISPDSYKVSPSEVLSVIIAQPNTNQSTPRISVIKIDNGGTSANNPSRAVVGVHMDGELWSIEGNYRLSENVVAVKSATFDASRSVLNVTLTKLDSASGKEVLQSYVVDLRNAVSEVSSAVSEDDQTYFLKSKISAQAQ